MQNSQTPSPTTLTNANMLPVDLRGFVDNDTILVLIDIECHCRNESNNARRRGLTTKQRRICEVGITVLDSRDIASVASSFNGIGDRGYNLAEKFKSFELGVSDAKHGPHNCRSPKSGSNAKIGNWCSVGEATDFKFGNVIWVSSQQLPVKVRNIIDDQTGIRRHGDGKILSGNGSHRSLVFMYFDDSQDTKWLIQNGISLAQLYPNSSSLDIQRDSEAVTIAKLWNRSKCSAKFMFDYMGIPTTSCHNGGNDTVYEMQAYLAGKCLTDEQRYQFEVLHKELPLLPAIWADGFDWRRDRIGPAATAAHNQNNMTANVAQVDGIFLPRSSTISSVLEPSMSFHKSLDGDQVRPLTSTRRSAGSKGITKEEIEDITKTIIQKAQDLKQDRAWKCQAKNGPPQTDSSRVD